MHLNERELDELLLLLERAYLFVKDGPNPNLETSLKDYLYNLRNKVEDGNFLECPICNFEYSHLIATLSVIDNDQYETSEILVNNEYRIVSKNEYKFRSQGNLHILFRCEDGHFFIKSFDGHKGIVYVDDNPLMENLTKFLNESYSNRDEITYDFNYELLGNIEIFFKTLVS
ncbi:hypothetical protein AQ616_15795 [Oceanobacillus sp. E9]|uniref:hypothetical protein n=1 Tax=Oceanobacillus TaxID=182709 RepID=UPI00084E66F6|nr:MULTISPECIES: hypothetical protein [Oceanobacillus]OEH53935.1 hypothetical protein AQ616_15795 [Oceanobacillus sp. E9]